MFGNVRFNIAFLLMTGAKEPWLKTNMSVRDLWRNDGQRRKSKKLPFFSATIEGMENKLSCSVGLFVRVRACV